MKLLLIRDVKPPQRGTDKAAGIDFFIPNDWAPELMFLDPGAAVCIPSGVKCQVPPNYALVLLNKSGVARDKGLQVGAQVIDEDYQGEIHLHLFNRTNGSIAMPQPGDKLTQGLLIRLHADTSLDFVTTEEELWTGSTPRGAAGFGSTGTK